MNFAKIFILNITKLIPGSVCMTLYYTYCIFVDDHVQKPREKKQEIKLHLIFDRFVLISIFWLTVSISNIENSIKPKKIAQRSISIFIQSIHKPITEVTKPFTYKYYCII